MDEYINRIFMVPHRPHNRFYRIVRSTDKMFCLRRLKCATEMVHPTTLEAKIEDEYEDEAERRIRKTSIVKFPQIYCMIVQYDI